MGFRVGFCNHRGVVLSVVLGVVCPKQIPDRPRNQSRPREGDTGMSDDVERVRGRARHAGNWHGHDWHGDLCTLLAAYDREVARRKAAEELLRHVWVNDGPHPDDDETWAAKVAELDAKVQAYQAEDPDHE